MRVIYEDEHFVAIDKPEGYFVHPPEASGYPVAREKICLHLLREFLARPVYPIHRLDAPTSGLVIFAYTKDGTRKLSRLFADRVVDKRYLAVVRGYAEREALITLPLESSGKPVEAETALLTLARVELPFAVGNRHATTRYSLCEARPATGRWHQIRRHLDRIAHPVVGDVEHGDSHHNRFFRDKLGIRGLCLRAQGLSFTHPWTGKTLSLEAPTSEKWTRIRALFESGQIPN